MSTTAAPLSAQPANPVSTMPVPPAPSSRLASVDAYRGFVMLLMMGEVLRFSAIARAMPENGFWRILAHHQTHTEWIGCSLHDLIQPSFSFLVGVALPFSVASRLARGQSHGRLVLHAWWRALVLVLLGVYLRSQGKPMTYWTFEDTLTQIGLGYGFLFLLGFRPRRDHWIALGVVLVGTFVAFALWPLPPAGFDYSQIGISAAWLQAHGLEGFARHWQKGTNLAAAFDTWFLNLFPRERPWTVHPGGYATLNFVPTLGTMILGLIAGTVLRDARAPGAKTRWFVVAGLILLGAGVLLGSFGVVPVVKRIWTPSWVLFSGGWCFLLLAAFHAVIDRRGLKAWAFPLVVVGTNSIAAYVLAHGFDRYVEKNLLTHVGAEVFGVFGPAYQASLLGAATLLILWLVLYWMWKRKLFLKV